MSHMGVTKAAVTSKSPYNFRHHSSTAKRLEQKQERERGEERESLRIYDFRIQIPSISHL